MELNPVDREVFVPQPHDGLIGRIRGDQKAIRRRHGIRAERVIPCDIDRVRQSLEKWANRLAGGILANIHRATFPVDELRSMNNCSAEGLENALVTEADAK